MSPPLARRLTSHSQVTVTSPFGQKPTVDALHLGGNPPDQAHTPSSWDFLRKASSRGGLASTTTSQPRAGAHVMISSRAELHDPRASTACELRIGRRRNPRAHGAARSPRAENPWALGDPT